MVATRSPLALAFLALALTAQPAPAAAQNRGGGNRGGGRPGGMHSGGGHRGGGYAVPRGGSPGYSPRSGAQARHPQAGTGGHYYSHGGYYGYRHGGYYGYRHGGYYGYYRPYAYSSFYYGWPYYYSAWWPYGSAGYYPSYYSPSYGYGYPYGYDARMAPPADGGGGYDEPEPQHSSRDTGRVRLEARPSDASVYVDDEFWGNARETKSLTLRSGRHAIEVVRPGFATVRRDVEVVRGETSDVLLELERQ